MELKELLGQAGRSTLELQSNNICCAIRKMCFLFVNYWTQIMIHYNILVRDSASDRQLAISETLSRSELRLAEDKTQVRKSSISFTSCGSRAIML